MKKLMIYCHSFFPENSGYANAYQNLIKSIIEHDKNIKITITTPYPLGEKQEEISIERVEIIRLKPTLKIRKMSYIVNDYFYAKQVSNFFRKLNCQMLLVETFDRVIFINSLDKDVLKKTSVRIHATSDTEYTIFQNSALFKFNKIFMNLVSKKVRWILSTNSYHIDFYQRYFMNNNKIKIGDKNFFVLPNPVNIQEPVSFGVNKKIKVFTLGRMAKLGNNQKGFLDFIYSLKLLPEELLEKFDITIVGKGDMRNTLISLCYNLKNVNFIEYMSHNEVISTLKDSDIVILPSRYEGLSMFALEALSTGNCCIFSETGGLIDMIEDNGFLFKPQDIESLTKILSVMANKPKKEIEIMKKNSIEICKNKFSPHIVNEKFQKIYELISRESN